MPREKETYRDQLADLYDTFGKVESVFLKQAAQYCGADPRTLQADASFPKRKMGNKYKVNLIQLARWLAS